LTLIEIIVVLVILAICAAVAVPYLGSTSDLTVLSAARTVAADLQYAQSEAITTQNPVTVTFNTAAESYRLTNASGDIIHPITREPQYVVDFGSRRGFTGLDVVSAVFGGPATVTFDALGAPDNPGAVTLRAGPHVYRIDVSAITGKIAVTVVSP